MSAVVKLTERVEDVRFEDVQSTLERALEYIKPGGAYATEQPRPFVPTKVVCIFVDEHEGRYTLKLVQSQGKVSETIALLEIMKNRELNYMFGG